MKFLPYKKAPAEELKPAEALPKEETLILRRNFASHLCPIHFIHPYLLEKE